MGREYSNNVSSAIFNTSPQNRIPTVLNNKYEIKSSFEAYLLIRIKRHVNYGYRRRVSRMSESLSRAVDTNVFKVHRAIRDIINLNIRSTFFLPSSRTFDKVLILAPLARPLDRYALCRRSRRSYPKHYEALFRRVKTMYARRRARTGSVFE